MVLPIQGSSQDNVWYDNTYTFKYKSDTYDRYVFFVDPDTGIVPSDIAGSVRYNGQPSYLGLFNTGPTTLPTPDVNGIVDKGNGWGRFVPEKMIDFNLLFTGKIPQATPAAYGLDLQQFLGS